MLEANLFFGFPLDESMVQTLDTANPHLKQMFIDGSPDYLQTASNSTGQRHMGKFIQVPQETKNLELVQDNILSLCKRFQLSPNAPFVLFTIAKDKASAQ